MTCTLQFGFGQICEGSGGGLKKTEAARIVGLTAKVPFPPRDITVPCSAPNGTWMSTGLLLAGFSHFNTAEPPEDVRKIVPVVDPVILKVAVATRLPLETFLICGVPINCRLAANAVVMRDEDSANPSTATMDSVAMLLLSLIIATMLIY
jgi:hypothetical protein